MRFEVGVLLMGDKHTASDSPAFVCCYRAGITKLALPSCSLPPTMIIGLLAGCVIVSSDSHCSEQALAQMPAERNLKMYQKTLCFSRIVFFPSFQIKRPCLLFFFFPNAFICLPFFG